MAGEDFNFVVVVGFAITSYFIYKVRQEIKKLKSETKEVKDESIKEKAMEETLNDLNEQP